jgi:hypothetical protein
VPRVKRFKRATKQSKKPKYKTDKKGTVRVRIALADPDAPATFLVGNMTKQMSVDNAKVSDVVKRVDYALFGRKS